MSDLGFKFQGAGGVQGLSAQAKGFGDYGLGSLIHARAIGYRIFWAKNPSFSVLRCQMVRDYERVTLLM